MAYIKTTWIDDETVVNATRMNNIETGIENLQNVPLLAVSDTAPSECEEGDKYFNTTSKKIFTATGTNTWGSTGEDPLEGILYIVFSTKTTYSLDNGDLISVGGGGAEIAISTTEPEEEEVLWINPEDTPAGSLNPITNTHSEATDKGYSCNYLNGKMGEVLWTNSNIGSSFGNVVLNIDTSEYNVIEIFYHRYQSDRRKFSTRILNEGDKKSQLFYSDYDNGVRSWNRNIDWNDTAFEFAHNTINGSTDDNGLIPIKIIGYK